VIRTAVLAWGLRLAAAACFGCWLIPSGGGYEVSPIHERATFKLGWPTAWYESEVRVDAGIVAHPPDLKIEHRPWQALGPRRIWGVGDGAVDEMPKNLPSFTGWGPTVCHRRERVNPIYGPLAPSVIGVGCLYVAGRLSRAAGKRSVERVHERGSPPTEV
jgi:hypothetical protein